MQKLLVTGGAGFIGSNFIEWMLSDKNRPIQIVDLDALTYAGNPDNLSMVKSDPRHTFVHGDIRDRALVRSLFDSYDFDTVVNFAAESHVDRSITDPDVFLTTNILGTQSLLDTARSHWSLAPHDPHCRDYRPGVRFLQVSTDEVYGALGEEGVFTEESPIRPSSPYSSSKASADLLTLAYHTTYGMPVNITRCSNNYGPYQYPEKLIPLMILKARRGERLPIYGSGRQVRDWIFVKDHCRAIETVLLKGTVGEVYNVGANSERSNLELVHTILRQLGLSGDLIDHVADRPGHDFRYAIDNTKIATQLGWRPATDLREGLACTVQWYLDHEDWVNNLLKRMQEEA